MITRGFLEQNGYKDMEDLFKHILLSFAFEGVEAEAIIKGMSKPQLVYFIQFCETEKSGLLNDSIEKCMSIAKKYTRR